MGRHRPTRSRRTGAPGQWRAGTPNRRRGPSGDAAAAQAQDRILLRWWAPAEPAAADEPPWPPRLPGPLAAARRGGPPGHPADLR
ncbi:hypothetical protein K701_18330 [Streptomyces fradiae ATCC 10745 = DSM 40063]|uniref:Uncharacterized protein n=1 Tax=Streptomyces fradiae ATCC 10745 = DSM 40063 TaxID=1319510 RepID=A0ABQ6XRK1_STRFR|nr:hypothetical protein K701_18330 [Streptomyces fradiae ATCC 10745 = DSM 40063]QEV14076.1 hypothetical protein CP974_21125 [Streptomyces fradiae ATCC 10745 = DSM 40063]